MATKQLTFEQGAVEYDINGKAKAVFNPTDANFTDRFYETHDGASPRRLGAAGAGRQ